MRAQIELWMLTKMAMLFFIVALGLIMVSFATGEKKTVCAVQAQAVARSLAGTITQVVNAPVEDERKIFPLEATLSIGTVDYSRYVVYIADHVDEVSKRKSIAITILGRDRDCSGTDSAAYPYEMISGVAEGVTGLMPGAGQSPVERGLLLEGAICSCPSGTFVGADCRLKGKPCAEEKMDRLMEVFPSLPTGESRAYYIVALKCQEKELTPSAGGGGLSAKRHLFLQACTNPRPENCINFDSGDLRDVCEWPPRSAP